MDRFITERHRALVRKVATDPANHTGIQLLRYLVVAVVAFVIDFFTLFGLTQFLHVFYLVSATISFCLGVATNYVISTKWVFANRTLTSRRAEFGIFLGIGVIGLLLTLLLMWIMTSGLGVYYLLSKIVVTALVFFWNFLARKFVLFNNKA